jgi:hypothetical protein
VDLGAARIVHQDGVERAAPGGRIFAQAHQPILEAAPGRGVGVGGVDIAVLGEVGIEGHPEQAGLSALDLLEGDPGVGIDDTIADGANAPAALGQEDAPVWDEVDGPDRRQSADDGFGAQILPGRRRPKRPRPGHREQERR